MNSHRSLDWARLDALLDRLLELDAAGARQLLDGLDVADAPLRPRLEAALAVAAAEAGPLANSALERWAPLLADENDPEVARTLAPGTRFGAWEIEGELGRGGMGTVYAAHRCDGTYEQRAALKLLAASADEPATRARFIQERQILARLEHPAIAHLFDGGVAPDGRPWLVIERVDGAPITAFADGRRLPVEERLALFAQVLGAVDYAQRSLVVHRDLKPANILVSETGAVKLLDFGIAKLLAAEGDDEIQRTRFGMALTPQYAAPEQVLGGAITTATDVYALGLVLYELLAGTRPYRVTGESALALERAIVESEPPPLAAALHGPAAGEIAAARGTSPLRLARLLTGELDAIVRKALAKDPAARYPSAAALAADLERQRAGLPITAHADSSLRRARKFARRHRVGVAATAALATLLVAGLVATGYALVQSRSRLAEAQRAEAIQQFLLQLFTEVSPEIARGREVTMLEAVDRGAERLRFELHAQPRTRVDLLRTIGTLYQKLAHYELAQPLLEEALATAAREYGVASPEVARVLMALGDLAYWRDDYEQALARQRAALAIFLAAGARERPAAASARFNVGTALRQLARYDEALAEQLAVLAIESELHGESSLEVAKVASGVALTLHDLAHDEEAIGYAERALGIRRQLLPEDHPAVADALEALGLSRMYLGQSAEALAELTESLAIRRRVFGNDHPAVLESLNGVASVLEEDARYDEALVLRREALALARRVLPPGSDSVAIEVNNFAFLSFRMGLFEDAVRGFAEAGEIWRQTAGDASSRVAYARNNLGCALLELGRAREAIVEVEVALAIRQQLGDGETAEVAQSLRILGMARLAAHDLTGARRDLDRAVELARAVYAARHPRLAEALASRAKLSLAERAPDAVRRDLEEALSIREERFGAEHLLTVAIRTELVKLDDPSP